MTKDDILQALRVTAMGRAGHPLQEQLAEKLAEVLSEPKMKFSTFPSAASGRSVRLSGEAVQVYEAPFPAEAPKRRKKAD